MQRGLTMLCEKQSHFAEYAILGFFADRSSFSWKRMEILFAARTYGRFVCGIG